MKKARSDDFSRTRFLSRIFVLFASLIAASNLEAGNAYLKGGWLLYAGENAEIDLGDRWWIGGGSDWRFAGDAYIGFELSCAYRANVVGGKVSSRMTPLDALISLKLKSSTGSARPYGGGGIGLASAFVWSEVEDPRFSPTSAWERALGYQLLGGVELGGRWLVEAVFERTYATAESVQVNPVGPEHAFSIAAGVTW